MKLDSKAQGLSLNVVIIAVLAILVLAVLAFILIRNSGNFSEGVATCTGECAFSSDECAGPAVKVSACVDNLGKVEGATHCCIT
jgi:hypothetical protein